MVAASWLVQADLSGTAFGGTPTWTDITAYVLTTGAGQPISLTGPARQDEQADTTPSTCSFTLINDDGRFTPGKQSTTTVTQITDTFNRANSTSTLGTTSDGNATWTVFAGTWGINGNQAYISAANLTGNARQFALIDAGTADADVQVTFAALNGSLGAALAFRATDENNHLFLDANGRVCYFQAGIFTNLGTFVTGGFAAGDVAKVSLSGSTIKVYKNGALQATLTSTVFQTVTKHGLASDPNVTGTRFDDFSVSASLLVVARILPGVRVRVSETVGGTTFNRFDGYVDAWEQSYAGPSSLVTVNASDILARMGTFQPLQSLYVEECMLDAPVALYPLTEPDGSLSAGNIAAASQAALAVAQSKYGGGDVAFGAGTGLPTDGVASLMLNTTLTTGSGDDLLGYYLSGAAPTLPAGSGTAEVWFVVSPTMLAALNRHTGASATPLAVPLFAFTSGSQVVGGLGLVSLDSTTIRVCWMTVDSSGLLISYFYNSNINVNDGGLHYAAASLAPSGNTSVVVVDGNSSTTLTLGIPALTSGMTTVVGATGGTFYGSSTPLFRGTVAYAALYPTALSAARMTAHYTAGKTGFAGESTGAHVSRLLSYRPNTGASVGTTTGTVGVHATAGETLQQALLDTAKAEGGVVYANGLGQITVRGRSANYNPSSVLTLDVSKDQVQADLTFRIDTQQLENDVTVSRVNGATQRVLDATSQATYGVRAVSDTLIVNTDVDALAAASWRLNSRKTAVVRSPSVSVDLLTETSTAYAQAVLAAKPLDMVTVSNLPATSPATSVAVQVQGWSEQIGMDVWTVSFFTTPLPVAVMSWDSDAAHGWDAAAWAW